MTINYQYPFGFQGFPPSPIPFANQNINPSFEQSYVENILRLNKGKIATIYMNFEGSQWGSKVFKGEITAAGKDHIIIKDTQTGVTYLLLTIYLSYVAFDNDIEYEYPYV
jgi:spore germination protein Q